MVHVILILKRKSFHLADCFDGEQTRDASTNNCNGAVELTSIIPGRVMSDGRTLNRSALSKTWERRVFAMLEEWQTDHLVTQTAKIIKLLVHPTNSDVQNLRGFIAPDLDDLEKLVDTSDSASKLTSPLIMEFSRRLSFLSSSHGGLRGDGPFLIGTSGPTRPCCRLSLVQFQFN